MKVFVISGPGYIRQKYNEPVEVKEVPVEEKNNKSATGSPHFYRKGTTPTQSLSGSPCPSPSASPTTVKNTFNKIPAVAKENRTPTAESSTAGKDLLLGWKVDSGRSVASYLNTSVVAGVSLTSGEAVGDILKQGWAII